MEGSPFLASRESIFAQHHSVAPPLVTIAVPRRKKLVKGRGLPLLGAHLRHKFLKFERVVLPQSRILGIIGCWMR